jgi:D-galactarolactone isomerase
MEYFASFTNRERTMTESAGSAASPRLRTPPGACDTHMHFYDARYKTAPTAHFTPPDALIDHYRRVQQITYFPVPA